MLNETEQLKRLFSDKRYVLIALPRNADGDAVAAGLALQLFLEKQHKQADIVSAGFVAPKNLKFLPKLDGIKSELTHLQQFIIKVDVSHAPIESLSYDVKDNWLSIHLSPKHGAITKNELRTAQSAYRYDLVVAIGSADWDHLGDIYFNNTDLFHRLPVINLDNNAANEHYAQVNAVDLNATSLSEIIFNAMRAISDSIIDADMATAILTGLIIKTKSFKTASVTPATLQLASELIKLGAKRDQIIRHLYRTKTIATLKLWGQALSHLQTDKTSGLVWSALTRDDFIRAGAAENDLHDIIDELLINSPEAKMVLLIYENQGQPGVHGILTVEKEHDALALLAPFNPLGNKKQATFAVENKTLLEAQNAVLEAIKKLQHGNTAT